MKCYELSHQKNIRDLGGLVGYKGMKVKPGRLFRGGYFSKVDEEDLKIIRSFHLTDIVDFRGEREFKERPDPKLEGVVLHNFSALIENIDKNDVKLVKEDANLLWFVGKDKTGKQHMIETYTQTVLSDIGKNAYKKFFKLLCDRDDRVVYFHCSQGKDRAGLAAFYLEIALGVSLEDAKKDYLLTNVAMEERIKKLTKIVENQPFYNEKYQKSLVDVFSAREEYLDTAIKTINEKYGSVLDYIVNQLEVDIDRLRKIYLE